MLWFFSSKFAVQIMLWQYHQPVCRALCFDSCKCYLNSSFLYAHIIFMTLTTGYLVLTLQDVRLNYLHTWYRSNKQVKKAPESLIFVKVSSRLKIQRDLFNNFGKYFIIQKGQRYQWKSWWKHKQNSRGKMHNRIKQPRNLQMKKKHGVCIV